MTKLTLAFAVALQALLAASAFAETVTAAAPSSTQAPGTARPTLLVRTTAYTHREADHRKYDKASAAGTRLRSEARYTSAAADWSVFPLGTIFRIKGLDRIFVIDDYGRALVGTKTIDLYHPNRSSMKRWGVQQVEIEILKFGSFEESTRILSARTHHPHCKAMHSQLLAVLGN